MRRWWPILLLAATLPVGALGADDPRAALERGRQAYERKAYDQALEAFAAATAGAAERDLDPAVPLLNEGNALMQLGRPDEAARRYADALRSPDLALQAKAYHNRGRALGEVAAGLAGKGQLDEALQGLDEALAMYRHAMLLDPRDEDPKVNHELAVLEKRRLEEEKKQQQQQQQQNNDEQKDGEKQKEQDEQKSGEKPQDERNQPAQEDRKEPGSEDSRPDEQAKEEPPPSGAERPGDQRDAAQGRPAERMTPEEARMMLDAMREQEQAQRERLARERIRSNTGRMAPVDKDW